MTIEWDNITWYSKITAVILFVATFFLGFWLGTMKTEKVYVEVPHLVTHPSATTSQVATHENECDGLCNLLKASTTADGQKFIECFNDVVFSMDYPQGFKIHTYPKWSLEEGVLMSSDKYKGYDMYITAGTAKGWGAKYGGGGVYYDWFTDKFFMRDEFQNSLKQINPIVIGSTKGGQPIYSFDNRESALYPFSRVIILYKNLDGVFHEPLIVAFSDFGIGSGSLPTEDAAQAYLDIISSTKIRLNPFEACEG